MYEFKPIPEIVRAAALAVIVYIAIAATTLGSVTDWHTFATAFATGLASAIGTAIIGVLTKPAPTP